MALVVKQCLLIQGSTNAASFKLRRQQLGQPDGQRKSEFRDDVDEELVLLLDGVETNDGLSEAFVGLKKKHEVKRLVKSYGIEKQL